LRGWAAEFLPPEAAGIEPVRLERLLEMVRGDVSTLADLPAALAPYLGETPEREPDAAAALVGEKARAVCETLADVLATVADWRAETLKSAVQSTGQRLGTRGRELFQPVRAALTGRTHGPELPLIMEALGRERAVSRLREAAATGGTPA
jgi:nondiscriminating glutamyl-tRNA synthetase